MQSIPAAKTALKIIVWMACFIATLWNPLAWSIPATLLGLKILLRSTRSFHLQTDVLEVPRKVKIPSMGNFRALRNQEAGSDLSIIPYQGNRESKIHAHSHLLTDYFQNLGSKVMRQGLDEKEGSQTFDLSQCPSATPKNIHLYLDYQYGLGIEQTVSVEQLISLFQFADFVLAADLKKEILQLVLHLPESREDVRLAPLFRNMLLFLQLDDEEFEYLFTWYRECAFATLRSAILNEEVEKSAENGNIRAKLLLSCFTTQKGIQFASELEDSQNPLGQFIFHTKYLEREPARALYLLQSSADKGCASAKGVLSQMYFHGELGLRKDENRAFKLAEETAAKDNLYGLCSLGLICCGLDSQPQIRDSKKGLEHLQKAASIGFRQGEYFLAICFERGIGTKVDNGLAREFYQRAKRSFEMRNDHSMDQDLDDAIQRLR